MDVAVVNSALIQRDYDTSDLPPQIINFALYDFEYVAAGPPAGGEGSGISGLAGAFGGPFVGPF